uniref:Uncharacterized protein n=1 Tax=Rhizophora mucronata TaxID=61149 RepID=A0A2P2QI77_RHIMU
MKCKNDIMSVYFFMLCIHPLVSSHERIAYKLNSGLCMA